VDSFTDLFLKESQKLIENLDRKSIESLAEGLARVRSEHGRLFILGVGGSSFLPFDFQLSTFNLC